MVQVLLVAAEIFQRRAAQVPREVEMDAVVVLERADHGPVRVRGVRIVDRRVLAAEAERGVVVQTAVVHGERVQRRDRRQQRVADAVRVVPLELRIAQARHGALAEIRFELRLDHPAIAGGAVFRRTEILDEAVVAIFFVRAEQVTHVVGDRAADQRIGVIEGIVAALQPHFAFELIGRALRDHVDRAADGVAPVQRALRAAQNFGALDEQRGRRGVRHRSREDAVRVQRDGGIGADRVRQTSDAADRETIVISVSDARREASEIFHRVDAEQSARLARVRGYGDRYVLNVD